MGNEGSTTVMGFGRPNLTPCIEIINCGPDHICGGPGDVDDTVISTAPASTDANGKFTATVSPALTCGEEIFARDICEMPPLDGPAFVVICIPTAPTMSPPMIILLIATLSLVGLLGLARLRWTK